MAPYPTPSVAEPRHLHMFAGTPHNRASFLRAARAALSGVVEYGGELTQGDALSCLRLLCSNFSAGAVRNAWSSAVALYAGAWLPLSVVLSGGPVRWCVAAPECGPQRWPCTLVRGCP
jgi:hypothetical protein